MIVVDVKLALSTLRTDANMTQQEIAVELGCTQANVCYHLNNKAKRPTPSALLVERIKAVFASRSMAVPMVTLPVGAI
jgi:predicted transcriptional regulator